MTCRWQCQRTSHDQLWGPLSIRLPLLKKHLFLYMVRPLVTQIPPKAQKGTGLTCNFSSVCHPPDPADGRSNGHLPCQSHSGFANLPEQRVQLSCLSARLLTPDSLISPPALTLPYITIKKPQLITSHVLPFPTTASKDISCYVTQTHKFTCVFISMLLSVSCWITDSDPSARILPQVWTKCPLFRE